MTDIAELFSLLQGATDTFALTADHIGDANISFLRQLFPRQQEFELTNIGEIISSGDRITFSATFNSLQPWQQVEAAFSIFDFEDSRHIIFYFNIPTTFSATIYLTQYSLKPDEALPETEEAAPYLSLLESIQGIDFHQELDQRIILFSSLDYSSKAPGEDFFPEVIKAVIPPNMVRPGLNFPLIMGLSEDFAGLLAEILEGVNAEPSSGYGAVFVEEDLIFIQLSQTPQLSQNIENFALTLDEINMIFPLSPEVEMWPEFTLQGAVNIDAVDNFVIAASLDLYHGTLALDFKNFPTLNRLFEYIEPDASSDDHPERLVEYFPHTLDKLLTIQLSELWILMNLNEGSIESINLSLTSDTLPLIDEPKITIKPTLDMQIVAPFEPAYRQVDGQLQGVWELRNSKLDTSLNFPDLMILDTSLNFPDLMIFVAVADGSTINTDTIFSNFLADKEIPATLDITELEFQGDFAEKSFIFSFETNLNSLWQLNLNSHPIIELTQIRIGIGYEEGSQYAEIACLLKLNGTEFFAAGEYDSQDGFTFFAKTAQDEVIDLSTLATTLMKGLSLPENIPDNLVLADVNFSLTPNTSTFFLSGRTTNEWPISDNLNLDDPNLEDIILTIEDFSLSKSENSQINGLLKARLSIEWLDAQTGLNQIVDIELYANKDAEDQTPWEFQGRIGPGQKIPIDDLVHWLSTKFGTDEWLPAEVKGVDVTDLSLTFTSDGRFFKFTCAAEITIDEVFVPISLDINLEKDDKEKYSKGFGGTIEIEGLLFELKFNRNEANESILIGSLAQAGDQVISLSQLVTNFLPADLTTDIPDIDITPNNVVFAYQKLPEGTSPALFTLDMGGGHVETLGELPLVGEYLKEYEVSITYRIALASADISNEQVASINDTLPDDFTKLPAAPGENLPAIGEGFNVLASINLAGDPLQLTSGNGNGGAADAGSAGGESPANGNAGSSAVESNVTWVSLQRSVGPLYFSQVGFRYQNGRAAFLLDVSLTIAGLTFSLQGLAISSPLTAFLPELELAGFGLGYQNGPLEISGIFMRVDSGTEFSGAAIIKAQTFSLTAYGAYSEDEETRDPSMFLYAILDKVLGGPSFFYVTGLALGFGYNRDVIVPAIENVADFPLVAAARQPVAADNPLAAAKAVLDDLKNSVPPKIGAYWVAAGVRFSSFQLIESFALLLVKFGQELDIVLLGISTLRLPKDKSLPPYLYAELQFKVSVQPAAGVIKAEAQLTDNSYLIDPEASLRGGFAFYAWFAGAHNGDFVLSLGGYHPRFAVPSHYPQNVPAITINWPLPQYKLSIKGTAYFALTPSSIMAGGTLQAVYDSGAIWASFTARADFLINWKPFFYDISLHLMLQVRATLDTLFGPISAETSLSANLHLWGPEFAGTAHVEWYFVSFDIAFGDADRPTHRFLEWPEFRDAFLPKPESETTSSDSGEMTFAQLPICRLNISSGLVAEIKNEDEVEWVVNPDELMLATETFMPATEVSFQVSQDDVATVMSGADIGFRPLGSGAVRSTHQITIRDSESGQVLNLVDEWAWAPDGRRQGVPAELWHTVNTEKEPAPSADILPNRLVGLDGLRPRADQDNLLSKKKTPELELLTFKFDPLPEKYLPLSIGTESAPVFKVSEETDPFHFTEDLAAIPSSLEKIKETAQTDLVNTNRLAVLKAARTAGFALETDGKLEILVETVETAFQAPPMLGFLGSTGIRQRTVDPAKRLPLDEPTPSLRETAVRLVALLYQYKYAAAARISDTVMGGHVVPPDPHSDKVTFRKAAEVSGPEAVTAASVTSAPAQKLAVGQSQTWQLESEDPNEALKTAIVLENSRGQRVRIVSLDRYGRLLNDETVDGRATSIRHDLDRQTAHLLLTGLPVPEAVSGPESKSTSNQTVGWNSASTLIQMQPRLFVGDEVLVRSQASRRRRQAGDSGVDLIEGLAAVNQNLHIDSRGDLTSGWLRTFLPAGDDLQTLALALRRSELEAPARPNSVVQVVRENGDSLQLKPIFIVRESEIELILLYSLPGDLRLEKGKTHVVLTETTAGWQIDGVMGIRERPGRVRANWSQYRLQPDVTRTAAAPDLTAQVALVLNE